MGGPDISFFSDSEFVSILACIVQRTNALVKSGIPGIDGSAHGEVV